MVSYEMFIVCEPHCFSKGVRRPSYSSRVSMRSRHTSMSSVNSAKYRELAEKHDAEQRVEPVVPIIESKTTGLSALFRALFCLPLKRKSGLDALGTEAKGDLT